MKLTKPILKQIIKESIEDEYKQKIKQLMYSGDEGHIEQAAALLDALMPENTTSVVVYLVYSKTDRYGDDDDLLHIHGAYSSLQKAKMAISGITPYQERDLFGSIGVLPIMIDDSLKSRNPGGEYDFLIGHGEDWDPIK